MKLIIDEQACQKHGLTTQEALLAWAIRHAEPDDWSNLLARQVLVKKEGLLLVTQHWSDVLDEIICDSPKEQDNEERLNNLAMQIQQCFPKAKMLDRFGRPTPYFYRCNKTEIKNKLKKFFFRYGDVPDEDIIDATKRYVASFGDNYAGMRLAKYFIWKDDKRLQDDGETKVEALSDLATFLENKGSEGDEKTSIDDDWMITIK